MALRKLRFKPGINRDITEYSQEGGWYESNKVRFFKGFPRKIGGWTKRTITEFKGVCRSMFAIGGLDGVRYMALGTNEKILLNQQGGTFDITPERGATLETVAAAIALASPYITTGAAGTGEITVKTSTNHNASVGDYVTLASVTTVDGITAAQINIEHKITEVSSTTTFKVVTAGSASSGSTNGGGTSGTATFQIPIGNETGAEGLGWGAGTWNTAGATTADADGGWNDPRSGSGIFQPMRIIYFTRYQDDLLFNIRYGSIYRWVWQSSPSTRAALLSVSPSSGTEVPEEVTQVLIAQDNTSNIILALGCTPYPASGSPDRDPLLIRWSDVSNPFNFTPSDLTTAGSLSVQNGSHILRGVPTTRETLIFTESTLNSLKFTGTFDVFRLDEISSFTSLVGPNAVATVDGVTYWMGLNKFYRYDGRISTLDCTVQDEVFENYNLDQADQIFAGLNSQFHEVWWFYPTGGSTTITNYVTYNYLENVWFYGDCDGTSADDGSFSRTAWQDAGVYNKPYAASFGDTAKVGNNLYKHESGNNAATNNSPHAALNAFITSGDMVIDQGDRFILMSRIIPDVDFRNSNTASDTIGSTGGGLKTPSVTVSVVGKKFPGAASYTVNESGETVSDPVSAINSTTIDQFTQQAHMRLRGRSLNFKIESTEQNTAWELGTPRIDIRPDGRRG